MVMMRVLAWYDSSEIITRKLYERHGVRAHWIVDPELEPLRYTNSRNRDMAGLPS
jgi:hypothetical protein